MFACYLDRTIIKMSEIDLRGTNYEVKVITKVVLVCKLIYCKKNDLGVTFLLALFNELKGIEKIGVTSLG